MYHPQFSSNYVRLGSNAGKERPESVEASVVVRLLAVCGGLCDCVAALAVDWMLCAAVLM